MDIDVQLENFDEDTRLVRHGNGERLLSKCFNCVNLDSWKTSPNELTVEDKNFEKIGDRPFCILDKDNCNLKKSYVG